MAPSLFKLNFFNKNPPNKVPAAPAGTTTAPTSIAAWLAVRLNWNSKYLGKKAPWPVTKETHVKGLTSSGKYW